MSLPFEIDVASVESLLHQQAPMLLLDCREPFEFELAKIEGAKLIPMGSIGERIEELEPFRGKSIIVYCHHGRRSLVVAEFLRRSGYELAQSMAGGIEQWSTEIDPQIPRY